MNPTWFFIKSDNSSTGYRYKSSSKNFINNFVVIYGLAVLLCVVLCNSFGEAVALDGVQQCQTSRESCDSVCGVTFRKPLFWTCHRASGYCLCPKKSKPGENCHRPQTIRETLTCRTSVCMSIKKKTKKHKKSIKRTPLRDRLREFRGNAAGAMICSDAQRGNKTFCTCFIKSSRLPHSIHVKPLNVHV